MKSKLAALYLPVHLPLTPIKCEKCSMFVAPSRCTLVEGKISPGGFCSYWVKR